MRKAVGMAQFPGDGVRFNIHLYREFSDEESATFKQMRKELTEAWQREELFFNVCANYDDLEGRASERPKPFRNARLSEEEQYSLVFFQLGRLFANYLSSVRMYHDHTEVRLKERFGRDSDQFRLFSEACTREYDAVFEYRFFSKLRNYAQHCGNPINAGFMNERLSTEGRVLRELSPKIDVSRFSQSFRWSERIREDLEERDFAPLDFCQATATHFNALQRIHAVVVSFYWGIDQMSIEYFKALEMEKPDAHMDACLFECQDIDSLKSKGEYIITAVPSFQVAFLDQIRNLCTRLSEEQNAK